MVKLCFLYSFSIKLRQVLLDRCGPRGKFSFSLFPFPTNRIIFTILPSDPSALINNDNDELVKSV